MKKTLIAILSLAAIAVLAQSLSFSSLTTVAPGTGPGEAADAGADALLLETGDSLLLEDGSDNLLLE